MGLQYEEVDRRTSVSVHKGQSTAEFEARDRDSCEEAPTRGAMPMHVVTPELSTSGPMALSACATRCGAVPEACLAFSSTWSE